MFECFFLIDRFVSNTSETDAPLTWKEYVEVIQYRMEVAPDGIIIDFSILVY